MVTTTKPKPKRKPTISNAAFKTGQFGTDSSKFNLVSGEAEFKPELKPKQTFQVGNQVVTKDEYNVIKGQLGFDSPGGMVSDRTEEVLSGIAGTRQNQAVQQQQTQDLATQQAAELAAVGQKDYTQLGMEQPQQAAAITGQQPTFQNRVAKSCVCCCCTA